MQWSWSESVLSNRERVMKELIQGRELASQLSTAFDNRSLVNGDDGGSAEAAIKSEDYPEEEIKINCKSTSTFKDRRGYYKGRNTAHSRTRDTPAFD
ncbi:hypothetical protein ACFXTN_009288 [Malus domestica]